eukprot:jgi/Mesvir1/3987/Mv15042-RA.1
MALVLHPDKSRDTRAEEAFKVLNGFISQLTAAPSRMPARSTWGASAADSPWDTSGAAPPSMHAQGQGWGVPSPARAYWHVPGSAPSSKWQAYTDEGATYPVAATTTASVGGIGVPARAANVTSYNCYSWPRGGAVPGGRGGSNSYYCDPQRPQSQAASWQQPHTAPSWGGGQADEKERQTGHGRQPQVPGGKLPGGANGGSGDDRPANPYRCHVGATTHGASWDAAPPDVIDITSPDKKEDQGSAVPGRSSAGVCTNLPRGPGKHANGKHSFGTGPLEPTSLARSARHGNRVSTESAPACGSPGDCDPAWRQRQGKKRLARLSASMSDHDMSAVQGLWASRGCLPRGGRDGLSEGASLNIAEEEEDGERGSRGGGAGGGVYDNIDDDVPPGGPTSGREQAAFDVDDNRGDDDDAVRVVQEAAKPRAPVSPLPPALRLRPNKEGIPVHFPFLDESAPGGLSGGRAGGGIAGGTGKGHTEGMAVGRCAGDGGSLTRTAAAGSGGDGTGAAAAGGGAGGTSAKAGAHLPLHGFHGFRLASPITGGWIDCEGEDVDEVDVEILASGETIAGSRDSEPGSGSVSGTGTGSLWGGDMVGVGPSVAKRGHGGGLRDARTASAGGLSVKELASAGGLRGMRMAGVCGGLSSRGMGGRGGSREEGARDDGYLGLLRPVRAPRRLAAGIRAGGGMELEVERECLPRWVERMPSETMRREPLAGEPLPGEPLPGTFLPGYHPDIQGDREHEGSRFWADSEGRDERGGTARVEQPRATHRGGIYDATYTRDAVEDVVEDFVGDKVGQQMGTEGDGGKGEGERYSMAERGSGEETGGHVGGAGGSSRRTEGAVEDVVLDHVQVAGASGAEPWEDDYSPLDDKGAGIRNGSYRHKKDGHLDGDNDDGDGDDDGDDNDNDDLLFGEAHPHDDVYLDHGEGDLEGDDAGIGGHCVRIDGDGHMGARDDEDGEALTDEGHVDEDYADEGQGGDPTDVYGTQESGVVNLFVAAGVRTTRAPSVWQTPKVAHVPSARRHATPCHRATKRGTPPVTATARLSGKAATAKKVPRSIPAGIGEAGRRLLSGEACPPMDQGQAASRQGMDPVPGSVDGASVRVRKDGGAAVWDANGQPKVKKRVRAASYVIRQAIKKARGGGSCARDVTNPSTLLPGMAPLGSVAKASVAARVAVAAVAATRVSMGAGGDHARQATAACRAPVQTRVSSYFMKA